MVNIMSSGKIALLLLLFIIGMVGYMSAFIVDKTEIALRFQFGKVQQVYKKPGLYFMTPFVNKVKKIDNRLLTLDKPPATFWTGDQKQLEIDYFAIWRISDPVSFYNKAGWSIARGNEILSKIINAALTTEIRKYNINQVITSKRKQIMKVLVAEANKKLNGKNKFGKVKIKSNTDTRNSYGIEVMDVRVKQIEFPPPVREAVYLTMIQERKKRSTEHRSKGEAKAKKIRAIARKEETIILAKARQLGLKIRGEGDALATKITASVYGRNKEFYAFYRTLKGYLEVFKTKKVLVLDPNSEFFRYFDSSKAK